MSSFLVVWCNYLFDQTVRCKVKGGNVFLLNYSFKLRPGKRRLFVSTRHRLRQERIPVCFTGFHFGTMFTFILQQTTRKYKSSSKQNSIELNVWVVELIRIWSSDVNLVSRQWNKASKRIMFVMRVCLSSSSNELPGFCQCCLQHCLHKSLQNVIKNRSITWSWSFL